MTTPILRIQKIPLSHIDFTDRTYSMTPFEEEDPPDTIVNSIQDTGIIRPPVLMERDGDSFCIVGGKARLIAVRSLGISTVFCHILPKEAPERTTFTIALTEAISEHTISAIEKAVFFQKVTKICSIEEAAITYLPIMGLPQRKTIIDKLLALLTLEQPLAEAVHNGLVDEKVAYDLTGLSFRDRLVLFEVMYDLRLSVSNQRKLIEYCTDLSRRDHSSIPAILSSKAIQDILHHKDANPPQKAANLMSFLQSALSPRYSEAQKAFNVLKQSLKLPKWAVLAHTTAFEKDELILSLTFENAETLSDFCRSNINKTETN